MEGDSEWDAPLRKQVESWMGSGDPQQNSRWLYFELALAKELGLTFPQALVAGIRSHLQALTGNDADALNYAALAGLLNFQIGSSAAPSSVHATSFASATEAYSAWLWGVALGQPSICEIAARSVANGRSDSGAVKGVTGQDVDLFSTAADHRTGRLSPNVSVLTQFSDGKGYWHFPPHSTPNEVDLQSFYLAAYVGGRVN
jgi:hypothetical protein